MQVFEVQELPEFPYMNIKEVIEGKTVKDLLNNNNNQKSFLLVDHETKRIWMWNGPISSLKLQIYCGILARKLRQQLRLFYRVYPLDMYSKEDKKYLEILEKNIGTGQAKPIEKKDFIKTRYDSNVRLDIMVSTDVNIKKAFEYIDELPPVKDFERKFFIIGGNVYTDEEVVESFVKEEKIVKKPLKLGILNNGFTIFYDDEYSTRLVINDRKIQGIELFTPKRIDSKSQVLDLKIPIFQEEKLSKQGNITALTDAFKIPSKLPEEKTD